MIDTSTKKPLTVLTDGTEWPYVIVPISQLDDLRAILDRHSVRYEVDDFFVTFDDRPEEALVNFSRGADPVALQSVLDALA